MTLWWWVLPLFWTGLVIAIIDMIYFVVLVKLDDNFDIYVEHRILMRILLGVASVMALPLVVSVVSIFVYYFAALFNYIWTV